MENEAAMMGRLSAPAASRTLQPGVWSLPKGTERYRVKGGGSTVVRVAAGDVISVRDIEGCQPCEVTFIDATGRFDASGLGTAFTNAAEGIKAVLSSDDPSAARTIAALKRRGADLASAGALRLFGSDSPAGSAAKLTITREGILIVAAPGGALDPGLQDTATPIELLIKRSHIEDRYNSLLPEPMADPLQDIRIRAATASAYFVRAGEFIQVIDVSGRQCTDFQAFDARKVDKGLDGALDATVTRTLMSRSYPTPGLFSKAFDRDFQPLVEIVQDTVGRHDAFATACNARFYDDMGYPGHVNCTDNFNAVLQPYGIAPRRGWEALNYFYNTNIDHNNQLFLDEPWSRPGDYVLMRAMTDLVCVSSSCPDDIDAANAWTPTDIHIRTYSGVEKFTRAVAYRMTPDAETELTRETAFHPRTSALTRDFVEYRGYWLPNSYAQTGPIEEYWACRNAVVVTDLSPLRKFEVTGPDAEALLQYCLTRDIRKLSTGQVVYSAMCYEHGGIIDDGTLFRLGDNNFRWIGGDDLSGIWLRQQAEKMGYKAWVRSSTDQMHNIAIQGPKSRELLEKIVWTSPKQQNITELSWFRFSIGRIGHFDGIPIVVSRTGYTGELGYEIFCHPKDALAVIDAVWEAGKPLGLKPLGLAALDMVRIEAGLVFANHEFDDQTDPFEAGIGFTVPLKSKEDDFIGRDALLRRKANPRHVLVGIDMGTNDAVGNGDSIHIGRAKVGVITSATRSPILKKSIALARIDSMYAAPGTRVDIVRLDGQKRLPAEIVTLSHYDPGKTKPRS